jgi:hypothetical protein
VIVAICLEPRTIVTASADPSATTVETRALSDDPRDLLGPPYSVAEHVFDENDIEACSFERDDDGEGD